MDNKKILDLAAKNLEEIKLLVDSLRDEEKADPLLIEITVTKAKFLYQELMLLLTNEPATDQKNLFVVAEETSVPDDENPVVAEEETFSTDIVVEALLPEEVLPAYEETEDQTPAEPNVETEEIIETEMEEVEVSTIEEGTEEASFTEQLTEEDFANEQEPEEISAFGQVTDEVSVTKQSSEEVSAFEQTTEEVSAFDKATENETLLSAQLEPIEPEEQAIPTVETQTESFFTETTEEIETMAETEPVQESEPIAVENMDETITEIQEPTDVVVKNNEELSVNEKIAATLKHEPKVKGIPVTNIMGAIGINDRFLFTRELFTNDSKKFEGTVNHLDQLNNFIEAIEYLEANFKWTKNDASLKFMELLKRRFEN